MLTAGAARTLANDKINVSNGVQESHKKEFSGAQFLNWNEMGEYLKTKFVLGCRR